MDILKTAVVAAFVAGILSACAQEENPEGAIPQGYKDALEKADSVGDKLQNSLDGRGQDQEE